MARILVADDDPEIRKILKMMLERDGHEVTLAVNGIEATKLYAQRPPDLLITNIVMPDKEGIGTILDVRRDFPDAKILAISGGGQIGNKDYLEMAEKVGAQRSLMKPFGQSEILAVVSELVASGPKA